MLQRVVKLSGLSDQTLIEAVRLLPRVGTIEAVSPTALYLGSCVMHPSFSLSVSGGSRTVLFGPFTSQVELERANDLVLELSKRAGATLYFPDLMLGNGQSLRTPGLILNLSRYISKSNELPEALPQLIPVETLEVECFSGNREGHLEGAR